MDFAFNLRKQSGWWGDQTLNFSGRLRIDDLRDTLYKKSLCPKLDYPGVYLYRNIKSDGKMYIGRAVISNQYLKDSNNTCILLHVEGREEDSNQPFCVASVQQIGIFMQYQWRSPVRRK